MCKTSVSKSQCQNYSKMFPPQTRRLVGCPCVKTIMQTTRVHVVLLRSLSACCPQLSSDWMQLPTHAAFPQLCPDVLAPPELCLTHLDSSSSEFCLVAEFGAKPCAWWQEFDVTFQVLRDMKGALSLISCPNISVFHSCIKNRFCHLPPACVLEYSCL